MTERCLILTHDGYPAAALGLLADAFGTVNWLRGAPAFTWVQAAAGADGARSYGGLSASARPLEAVADEPWDHLFVLVSFDPLTPATDERLVGLLRRAYRRGATVCGVETGAAVLAAAGLLDGGEAAVHWANRDGFAEAFPDVALSDRPIARRQRCITCVGGTATLDAALLVIEARLGRIAALEVAKHLNHVWPPPESGAQGRPRAREPALDRALALMERHLEEPLSCAEIAERAGVSQRRMERLFRRALGTTPKGRYLALRLTRAQNLLQQTTLSVGEVATSAGFTSFAHFARSYRAHFGLPPSRDREQKTTAGAPRVFLDPAETASGGVGLPDAPVEP